MEVKRDILWRVYLSFIGIVIFGLIVLGRAIYIQQAEGPYWLAQAKEQQQKVLETQADRGTIYSEDGSMLSTSIPFFDIYIDFGAEGIRDKNGRFRNNLDSLSYGLSKLFRDQSAAEYKRKLQQGYQKRSRYYPLKKNISFEQYKVLRQLPLVREGRNKSGFIAEVKHKRLNPFGLLANRTIGLSREYIDTDGRVRNTNVGLEKTYDDVLKGESGRKLVRYLAGGVYVPIEGFEVEPEHGKDLVTTIDVNMQDIAEQALLRMMEDNECEFGTCIVMEVATGKIKAIANLGRKKDGSYWEDLNYAIRASEPGSTFKLATMLSLLEDGHITLQDKVDLEKGSWKFGRRTVYDSERHGKNEVTIKDAFKFSSNVGMAKMVATHYREDPLKFIDHLKRLHLHETSGIDLVGETNPIVKTPSSKSWSATTLPWMSFGYEVLVSPLQTLMLYNAVANDGKLLKPYLVNSVQHAGVPVQNFEPVVLESSICGPSTLRHLRECLEAVCNEEGGTGFKLFSGAQYRAAGKSGTALVANGKKGYSERIYQSSFAGYFPAENPKYSCIVVIKNKPHAKKFYGATVAGPVFREVADKIYAINIDKDNIRPVETGLVDSSMYYYAGAKDDMSAVLDELRLTYKDSSGSAEWSRLYALNHQPVFQQQRVRKNLLPDVTGMGLRDALFLLENNQLQVIVKGKGKVKHQIPMAGTPLRKNQVVTIELN